MKGKRTTTIVLASLLMGVCLWAASTSGSLDPSRIGVGADVLGMGGAGSALGGVSSLLNPAGLVGWDSSRKIDTMYTSLLGGDVSYILIGGSMPTAYGLYGITYLMGTASGASLRDTSGASLGTGSYSNSTLVFSTAATLSDISLLNWLSLPFVNRDKLTLGANLKLFSQRAEGSGLTDFVANGQDLDIGAIYEVDKKLNLGLVFQNILPQAFGGNMHWVNNGDYGIPLVTRLGVGYQPLDKLSLVGDIELKQGGMTPLHFGGVYAFNNMISVRGGIDQTEKPGSGLVTDLALGLGLNYQGFRVNYAYRPTSLESGNTAHYITLSYILPEKQVAKKKALPGEVIEPQTSASFSQEVLTEPTFIQAPEVALGGVQEARRTDIHIIQPADKVKTHDDTLSVRLLVKADLDNLSINGMPVRAVRGGIVGAPVNLNYGKQSVAITYTKDGVNYKAEKDVLRLVKFNDVEEGRWSKDVVEYLATLGLYWGSSMPASYQPRAELTVRDLGELIAKYKQIKTGASVDIDQATYDLILLGKRIGYPGGLTPRTVVNRGLAAAVITDLANVPVLKVTKSPFADVVPGKWFTDRVMAAKNAGLVSGAKVKGKDLFFPGDAVTREAMVTLFRPLLDNEVNNIKL